LYDPNGNKKEVYEKSLISSWQDYKKLRIQDKYYVTNIRGYSVKVITSVSDMEYNNNIQTLKEKFLNMLYGSIQTQTENDRNGLYLSKISAEEIEKAKYVFIVNLKNIY
jgi:hypothetical protein